MPNKEFGKPSKLKREEKEAAKKRKTGGKPTTETPHPVMEEHPGSRVPDPVTGEKPAPVKKPRVKKPKPVDPVVPPTADGPAAPSETPEA